MNTPEPGAPLARTMFAPATLPASRPAADVVVGTGRSAAVSLSTVYGSLLPAVGSTEADTVTWLRRSWLTFSWKLIVSTESAVSRTLSTARSP